MNAINTFTASFCISSVVLGLLFLLVPRGALNKSVKYIFALCFVCCLVGNIVALPRLDFSDFNTYERQSTVTEQGAAFAAGEVFSEALKSQNINFTKITVDVNKSADSSIVINKVTVYTDEQPQKILDVIGSDDYEVVIINE